MPTRQKIEKISVVGAGVMGNGLAHVFALNNFAVILLDIKDELLEKAVNNISKNLDRQIKKGLIDESQKQKALLLIKTTTDYNDIADSDIVIEAVYEDLKIKEAVLTEIGKVVSENCIIASNTTSISITKMSALHINPDKFIGLHFFNPVPMMKLVEIIIGLVTSKETCEIVKRLMEDIGKTPIVVPNTPGFIVSRVLFSMVNEAIFTLQDGTATAENIDIAMKLGANQPIGPLALADLIGLDISLNAMETMHNYFGDPKYRPAPLLKEMVDAGFLGRKTGRGFFKY